VREPRRDRAEERDVEAGGDADADAANAIHDARA
jgi:hypothetical protein